MTPLGPPDSHYLASVEGWLGLGNPAEAAREMEQLSPAAREHPEVMRAGYHLFAAVKNWESAAKRYPIQHLVGYTWPMPCTNWGARKRLMKL